MTKLAIIIGAVLLPVTVAAHPDHAAGGDFGILHSLTDPFHVGLAAVSVLVFLAVRRSVLPRRSLKQTGE